jgi:uncharacterized membrane protein YbhN (UPF0104 family)
VIYPLGNLLASLSLVPGGLGVAEGSIAGLTSSLTGASASTALAAAVLIRAAIVGLGVLSGLPGLLFVLLRTRRPPATVGQGATLPEQLATRL